MEKLQNGLHAVAETRSVRSVWHEAGRRTRRDAPAVPVSGTRTSRVKSPSSYRNAASAPGNFQRPALLSPIPLFPPRADHSAALLTFRALLRLSPSPFSLTRTRALPRPPFPFQCTSLSLSLSPSLWQCWFLQRPMCYYGLCASNGFSPSPLARSPSLPPPRSLSLSHSPLLIARLLV